MLINFIDTTIYNLIMKLFNMPMTHFMRMVTYLGSAYVLISICVLAYILFKNKKIPLIISINLILVYLLNVLIKTVVKRERPLALRLTYEDGYSFPSGHAMVSFAFYGLIIIIINKFCKNRKTRILGTTLISILIIFIGISRIYLGVHYATDVLGGFIIATIYLIVFSKGTINREKQNNAKKIMKGKQDGANI